MIEHFPVLRIQRVIDDYTAREQVPVSYVCTTDLKASDCPVDVFYRPTPHPEYGNHYFGLYVDYRLDRLMICNADIVEDLEFGMIEVDGKYYYSQSHHDYKSFADGEFIDGGRQYIRSNCDTAIFRVNQGVLTQGVEHE